MTKYVEVFKFSALKIAWKKASSKKTVTDDDLEAAGGIQNKNGGYTKIKSKNGSILRDFKNL